MRLQTRYKSAKCQIWILLSWYTTLNEEQDAEVELIKNGIHILFRKKCAKNDFG